MTSTNPFPPDSARAQIWEMLVPRDTAAFVAGDWERVAGDFHEVGFLGIRGAAHPDGWRIAYPTLTAYRNDWLAQSRLFDSQSFEGESGLELLLRATRLDEIEITDDQAIAHKKFAAVARLAGGGDYRIDWQSLYFLRRADGVWRISGFVGYLPHPFPAAGGMPGIEPVAQASQHVTAGPYSPVLRVNPGIIVAISGQGPIDMAGEIVGTGIVEQTRITLENCVQQLAAGGARVSDVFQVRVYLASMADWDAFNTVYKEYLRPPYPVRTAIEAKLWGGILVEVEMLANLVSR